MHRIWAVWGTGLALSGAWVSGAMGQDEAPSGEQFEEADTLAVATLLFKDGFYERANNVLDTVDPKDEAVDRTQYHRLRGFVASRLGKYGEAASQFKAAIRSGDIEPEIHLRLAQAYMQNEQWEKAALSLRLAPAPVKERVEAYLLESTAFVRLDKKYEAYRSLVEASEKFPEDRRLERQQLFLLIEMGLYQSAIERARAFLDHPDIGIEDRLALAQAFRKGGEIQRAILLLEAALLKEPNNQEARRELAAAYNQKGHAFVSAEVLRPVAWLDAEWARQAAELYRKAGQLEQATLMNQRITDQKAKVTQRLALLLNKEDFEKAATLDARLIRLGLLENEDLVYALAYAHFKTGNFARAETLLKRITDPDLFRKSVALRESIEQCVQKGWQCD